MAWVETDVDFMSLPIGAGPKDRVVGQTEWGGNIYQTPMGQKYSIMPTKRSSVVKALAKTAKSQPISDSISGVVKALLSGVVDTIKVPGRALSGEAVTYGDAFNVAGMAQLGAAAMPAPAGALRSGSMRSHKKYYHVVPEDFPDGDGLRSLYSRMGDDAYDEFAKRWPDAGDMGQYHADQVFLFDTPTDAQDFADWRGGRIMQVTPDEYLEVKRDPLEGFNYVQGEIPAEYVSPWVKP